MYRTKLLIRYNFQQSVCKPQTSTVEQGARFTGGWQRRRTSRGDCACRVEALRLAIIQATANINRIDTESNATDVFFQQKLHAARAQIQK